MKELRYTLVSEGSSDTALMPILTWLLRENGITQPIHSAWADLGEVRYAKKSLVSVKIRESIKLYPCDLLFVHRDTDRTTRANRLDEIRKAIMTVSAESVDIPPVVCVIPIRMQEAWLLFDEMAIRYAAGNRNGHDPLTLPSLNQLERLSDPKKKLHSLLKQASGRNQRRLKRFRPSKQARRVSEFIDDFSPLRRLSAFLALEQDIQQIIQDNWLLLDKT